MRRDGRWSRGEAMVEEARRAGAVVEGDAALAAERAPAPAKLLVGSLRDFGAHADGVHAGAMAFFGVLSLFPLVLLLVVLFSEVLPSDQARQMVIGQLSALLPDASPVAGATKATIHVQSAAVGVSIFTLLWGSVGVFMTVGYAFDRAWDVRRDRNILVQYLVAAGLTLAVGAAISVASVLTGAASPAGGVAVLALEALAVCAALVLLYRALPNTDVRWAECFAPAVAVTLVCGVARGAFTWYLGSIAHVGSTYGPVAGIAGLLLWLFVTSAVVVWGAELSHQLSEKR